MQAMILAAGFGTRLRPLTELRPKPLFPFFDKPLLLFLIEQLLQADCRKILVNCHYLAEQVMELLYPFPEVTVLEEEKILGTGGALRRALPLLKEEPLLVINSDIVQNFDLGGLYRAHGRTGSPVSMVTHRYPRFASLTVDDNGQVLDIGRDADMDGHREKLAFTGVHIIDPAVIERIPAGIFYGIIDLYRLLIAEAMPPASLLVRNSYWRDIGTVEDYLAVHADIIACPSLFAVLANSIEPTGFISPDAKLGTSVSIEDWVVIGSGVDIGDDVALRRCVVWDGAKIPTGSTWRDTVVV